RLNRIGMGKGFYDRFFNENPGNYLKVGICFDEQEEKAEKANALNLKDRNSYSPAKRKKDQETVSDWLKNFNNR
ncbi:5-formyltetrahydrofolate cyclo-ligase, partial [Mycoplasmopsis bovis]|uniref:5-formyltetrahydrofolate cyclo-ligase n=1 Tax=Mycoplasmopsis bovis TaxID=28903 RepID=UPI003D2C188D